MSKEETQRYTFMKDHNGIQSIILGVTDNRNYSKEHILDSNECIILSGDEIEFYISSDIRKGMNTSKLYIYVEAKGRSFDVELNCTIIADEFYNDDKTYKILNGKVTTTIRNIDTYPKPNAETLKAMRDAETGNNCESFGTLDDMLEGLKEESPDIKHAGETNIISEDEINALLTAVKPKKPLDEMDSIPLDKINYPANDPNGEKPNKNGRIYLNTKQDKCIIYSSTSFEKEHTHKDGIERTYLLCNKCGSRYLIEEQIPVYRHETICPNQYHTHPLSPEIDNIGKLEASHDIKLISENEYGQAKTLREQLKDIIDNCNLVMNKDSSSFIKKWEDPANVSYEAKAWRSFKKLNESGIIDDILSRKG